jgi:phosphotransferase system  glucose/maltose/N-acetylglucosamine-specific IIC component
MAKAPGGINSFGIAFMNRTLLPFGLHFIVTTLVNYTVVGGVFHLD